MVWQVNAKIKYHEFESPVNTFSVEPAAPNLPSAVYLSCVVCRLLTAHEVRFT